MNKVMCHLRQLMSTILALSPVGTMMVKDEVIDDSPPSPPPVILFCGLESYCRLTQAVLVARSYHSGYVNYIVEDAKDCTSMWLSISPD